MEVTLRNFTPDDLIQLAVWAKRIKSDQYMSRYLPERMTSDLAGLLWYVIQLDQRDIGAIWLEREQRTKDFRLGVLLGEEGLFSRGIGERAVKIALHKGRNTAPIEKVYLNVRLDNRRAISCYQKCGFEIAAYGVKQDIDREELYYARMEVYLDQATQELDD